MTSKRIKTNNSIEFAITKEGSLGLLANGDIGLRAWRKVKNVVRNSKDNLNVKK
jgi:hypothetical protein